MSSHSCFVLVIFSFSLLLTLDSAPPIALDSCPRVCGDIEIPYPFGIGDGCYLDEQYEIICNNASGKHVPFLRVISIEVMNISLPRGYNEDGTWWSHGSLSHASILIRSPITLGALMNLMGLRSAQWFQAKQNIHVDLEWSFRTKNLSSITTLGCEHRSAYDSRFSYSKSCRCKNRTESGIISATCACNEGYRGNPYILGGCEDGILLIIVAPCLLVLLGIGVCLYIFIRRRMRINRRNKFFKRNGGLLLQQQITSTGGSVETTKVFTSKELAKATGKFSETRVLGQGGQGKVYKGMLIDGRIVAVKKSTIVDEDQIQDFINEVVVLSQLSHRNIVKLIGCALKRMFLFSCTNSSQTETCSSTSITNLMMKRWLLGKYVCVLR